MTLREMPHQCSACFVPGGKRWAQRALLFDYNEICATTKAKLALNPAFICFSSDFIPLKRPSAGKIAQRGQEKRSNGSVNVKFSIYPSK